MNLYLSLVFTIVKTCNVH